MLNFTRGVMIAVLGVVLGVLWHYGVPQTGAMIVLFWIGCPHYNALGISCGTLTLDFVIERIFIVLLALFVFIGIWMAWRGRK